MANLIDFPASIYYNEHLPIWAGAVWIVGALYLLMLGTLSTRPEQG